MRRFYRRLIKLPVVVTMSQLRLGNKILQVSCERGCGEVGGWKWWAGDEDTPRDAGYRAPDRKASLLMVVDRGIF